MSHDPHTVTVDAFLADVRAMLEASPDATNPIRYRRGLPEGCAYRADVDGVTRRCVIGQYLAGHGIETTDRHEGRSASEVLRGMDYPYDVARIAGRVQSFADGPSVLDHDTGEYRNVPRAWGLIAARLDRLADLNDGEIFDETEGDA